MRTRFILLFAALAMVPTACVQTVDQVEEDGRQIVVHAWQEGALGSRTTVVDGGTKVYWEPNDEIKLFYKNVSGKFVAKNTELAEVAEFTGYLDVVLGPDGSVEGSDSIWGLYPYSEDATFDGEYVTTSIPTVQTGRAGSFDRNMHITLACSDGLDLQFYNVSGGLRFSLTQEGIKSVIFKGNGMDNYPLSGTVKLATEEGLPEIQGLGDEYAYYVILNAPEGESFQTGEWYYIEAFPVPLDYGFKMTFQKDGEYAELYSSNPVTISRGRYGSIANIDEGLVFKPTGGKVAEAVDLGLSVKWAGWNIGASSPEDIGDYITWGETQPKLSYSLYNYPFFVIKDNSLTVTKYNYSPLYGQCDYKTVLDPEDDAATVRWGGNWRLPTMDEVLELRSKCTWTWTTLNGMNGYSITSNVAGYADKSIFLPAAGGYEDDQQYLAPGSLGAYWTAEMSTVGDLPVNAFYIYTDSEVKSYGYYYRSMGLPMRPVEGARVPVTSIALDRQALELPESESSTLTAALLPENATAKSVLWISGNSDVAEVSSKGVVTAKSVGNAVIYAYSSNGLMASCAVTVTPFVMKSVDLGLSVKWANCNLGATAPEDNGSYFSWGETQPKEEYNWGTYLLCNGAYNTLTKYNDDPEYGDVDYKFVLEPEDDAAHVNLGGDWRMPVAEEIVELYRNTSLVWTQINGVPGYKFTSRVAGYTDKWIFLAFPTGYIWDRTHYDYDWALYFGSSLIDPMNGNIFFFREGQSYLYAYGGRAQGLPVRAVEGAFVPVTSIILDKTELTLNVGEAVSAPAVTVLPDNATAYSYSHKIDDTSIARFDDDGNIVGVAPGVTTYRAYSHNGLVVTCTITVMEGANNVVAQGVPSGSGKAGFALNASHRKVAAKTHGAAGIIVR